MTSHASWSLPLPSFTLISDSCETTTSGFSSWRFRGHTTKELGKCVPASPSSPQTSSRHSFRFRFVDDWNYTISIKDSKSATHCNCQKNSAECLHLHVYIYIYIRAYIYIYILIYTHTQEKNICTCTVALYIYTVYNSNMTFNMPMLFSKKYQNTMTSKQRLTLVTFQYNKQWWTPVTFQYSNPLLYIYIYNLITHSTRVLITAHLRHCEQGTATAGHVWAPWALRYRGPRCDHVSRLLLHLWRRTPERVLITPDFRSYFPHGGLALVGTIKLPLSNI